MTAFIIPCKFFAAGACLAGQACAFSHRAMVKKAPVWRAPQGNRLIAKKCVIFATEDAAHCGHQAAHATGTLVEESLAQAFVGNDIVSLYTFGGELKRQFSAIACNRLNKQRTYSQIGRSHFDDYPTRLYDGIVHLLDQLPSNNLSAHQLKQVVVFAHSGDVASSTTLTECAHRIANIPQPHVQFVLVTVGMSALQIHELEPLCASLNAEMISVSTEPDMLPSSASWLADVLRSGQDTLRQLARSKNKFGTKAKRVACIE